MSAGATARLFVAAQLPSAVCERLVEWARAVAAGAGETTGSRAGLRVLEPSSLHLTLCFLGARPVGEIDALGACVSALRERGGELELGAPVWLPPRRPNALAVEVRDPDGWLTALQRHVAQALSEAVAWEPERRRFRAHVTVARVRGAGRRRGREEHGTAQLPPTPRLSFAPEAVVLYRSWLAREGASYEALASCELAPTGG
jgi:RNA 2',3'-cyclic 3'-phosphodiesterase